MGNDCNIRKTMSVPDGPGWPGWAAEVAHWPSLARTRHTGEWRMSIENQLGFLIVVTSPPRHSSVSHHGHFIADNHVMETVRKRS